MTPKVSVIVPVYNVKKEYMKTCLDSILNQSYENLEVILVDDGSTDDSGAYCDKYAEVDKRVRVIHQVNAGVSAARNRGTAAACGAYIMYVDADDIIAPYAIEDGVKALLEHNADMAIGAVQKINQIEQFSACCNGSGCSIKKLVGAELDELRCVYMNNPGEEYVGIDKVGYINRGPYSRIICQSVAKNNPFPEGFPLGEDVVWNMRLLKQCLSICVVQEIWYGYLIYASSAVRKFYGNREQIVSRYLNVMEEENREFCERNITTFAKNVFMEYYCLLRYEYLPKESNMTNRQKIKEAKETINRKPWNILKNREAISKLPWIHRMILGSVSFGGWIVVFRIWEARNQHRSREI